MEHWLVHGPGDVQGASLVDLPLSDELVGLNVDCYALGRQGRRLYDSVFYSRCKGADKSGHTARLSLVEALGPCRFAGWAEGGETFEQWGFHYEYRPGEPMGRRVTYPFVRLMATEEGQTGNVYDAVYYNLKEGPLADLKSEGLDPGLTRVYLPGGGEIRPSTASSAAKDGGKETFAGFDETHLYKLPELVRMYDTVRRNLGKRLESEPWSFEGSTMYAPGEGSVAERTHDLAKAIREGKARRKRLLFDHLEAGEVDVNDEESVRAAMVEAAGDAKAFLPIERRVDEFYDPRNSVADSRRYFFNQAHSASDSWLAEFELKAIADATVVVADAEQVTLGFDGSRKRVRGVTDATALIGCRVSDGHLFTLACWEQPDGPAGDDWEVPKSQVDAAVRDAFARYSVVGFYADPAKWETYVAQWEAEWGGQVAVKATRGHPFEWWMTGGRATQIVRATERLHTAVVDKETTYDGSWPLTRHMLNARRKVSQRGVQIGKEHPESARKIDAAVAAILAFEARHDAIAAGAHLEQQQDPNRKRIYRF